MTYRKKYLLIGSVLVILTYFLYVSVAAISQQESKPDFIYRDLIKITPNNNTYMPPSYIPFLKTYEIDKTHDIWHAKNPSSYIIPNNEWVKYYSSQVFIDYDGRIKYKNILISWEDQHSNNNTYCCKTFLNNYVYDWEQFGNGAQGSLQNDDYWANADYYLANGMRGDCDEWMTTITSMLLSGEMSIRDDNYNYFKQIIPTKAVLGYVKSITRDGWVEYQVYNKTWITSTARKAVPNERNKYVSTTTYIEKTGGFIPIFEFTDEYFRIL